MEPDTNIGKGKSGHTAICIPRLQRSRSTLVANSASTKLPDNDPPEPEPQEKAEVAGAAKAGAEVAINEPEPIAQFTPITPFTDSS
jgi:hypothetical protein